MKMDYARSRYEKKLNPDGTVKEIFIAVKINSGGDVWEQGYWLTEAEKNAVVANESALTAIVDAVAVKGENALIKYRMTPKPTPVPPKPPVKPTTTTTTTTPK
jgi:hypothetical protein